MKKNRSDISYRFIIKQRIQLARFFHFPFLQTFCQKTFSFRPRKIDLNGKYKNVQTVILMEKKIRTKIRSYLKFRFGNRGKITNSSNVFRNATAHTRK